MGLGFLLALAGVILLAAGSTWFTGAAAVGTVLLFAGCLVFLAGLVATVVARRAWRKHKAELDRRWNGFGRF